MIMDISHMILTHMHSDLDKGFNTLANDFKIEDWKLNFQLKVQMLMTNTTSIDNYSINIHLRDVNLKHKYFLMMNIIA
jgi:beta-lactamase superfamily II metal-dependent hydrolase